MEGVERRIWTKDKHKGTRSDLALRVFFIKYHAEKLEFKQLICITLAHHASGLVIFLCILRYFNPVNLAVLKPLTPQPQLCFPLIFDQARIRLWQLLPAAGVSNPIEFWQVSGFFLYYPFFSWTNFLPLLPFLLALMCPGTPFFIFYFCFSIQWVEA